MKIPENYLQDVYAGWLGKIIGIRVGAPDESWTAEQIYKVYGDLWHYPVDYRDFAADDDTNGPLFYLHALGDSTHGFSIVPQDVGNALLNYAPYEHGFFWWGGYGVSTEHTAYLNLRHGIPAPRSGSIEQNGAAVAEQIGGQIFIDTWGLVSPGNPDQAARYARVAASVTHDGNAIYGGIFIAVCISLAFVEKNIRRIIEKALTYIPQDCEYTRVVRAVMEFADTHPDSTFRDCYDFLHDHFGYDRYPGNCHIIPNAGVIILSLLYGQGDFGKTVCISNMCGWDTDCNAANVGTIMGVLVGLDGIDFDKWRAPIHDFLACSSVMGSMNSMDIPYGASYIADLAYRVAGETPPAPMDAIFRERIDSCHFEYPGSTHSMQGRCVPSARGNQTPEICLRNTEEAARTGRRSLKAVTKPIEAGDSLDVYKKTYFVPADFHDNRYDPAFSPTFYPGQTIHGSVMAPDSTVPVRASLYAHEKRGDRILQGEVVTLRPGEWADLTYTVPAMEGGLIDEIGVRLTACEGGVLSAYLDDFYADGSAAYSFLPEKENPEVWTGTHVEVSQFTRLKGLLYLENGQLHLSCSDFGEGYTGLHTWGDIRVSAELTGLTGQIHCLNFRVQGAIRSYAAGMIAPDTFAILKNENGYRVLQSMKVPEQKNGVPFTVSVQAVGNQLQAVLNGTHTLSVVDDHDPYVMGAIGLSVREGSHAACRYLRVEKP